MKNSILYKYINLLSRFAIGIVAVWFIYSRIKDDFILNTVKLSTEEINFTLILVTSILLFCNWGIEALKWRFAIRNVEQLTIFKALQFTFTGITIGLLTPNRIGEIPARALLLNTSSFKEITLKTSVASFSQVVITFLIGGLGLIFTGAYFNIDAIVLNSITLLGMVLILILYFNVKLLAAIFKKNRFLRDQELIKALMDFTAIELFFLLGFSFLRYLVFFLQYWLVLNAFGIELVSLSEILLIPVCFLLASSIPTILISEIGVRGSVALFVYGVVSDFDIQIIMASVLLWLINVALPALLGLFNLKDFKLLKEE
ncbi:MAG: lysylphosphatidylglycerol synthase domain-containing protein [Vicingaceae bacterium]